MTHKLNKSWKWWDAPFLGYSWTAQCVCGHTNNGKTEERAIANLNEHINDYGTDSIIISDDQKAYNYYVRSAAEANEEVRPFHIWRRMVDKQQISDMVRLYNL